ncbi:unnamed protein product [Ixodes hexagonus]
MERNFSHIMQGGRFKPMDCRARHRVAILIPYRNREHHLRVFLYNMHQLLPRQQIDYGIFVIEQVGACKGLLAYFFSMLLSCLWGCHKATVEAFCFKACSFKTRDAYLRHDKTTLVFLVCEKSPSNKILPYYGYFGGVSALNKKHFKLVNGFSNKYWGWGAEDDDIFYRLQHKGLKISRYPADIARYTMLGHQKEVPSPERFKLLNKATSRYEKDGLNSLEYERKKLVQKKLYTWILTDLKPPK